MDWHALTTDYADPSGIRDNILEVATDWLAAGLDPARSTLFIQSLVPEHAELHLLLSMVIPVPWLERVPTYKEQQQQLTEKDLSTYGFLGYPLLQSADIIIYKADAVPVGEDQAPHVELTREVVRRFNNLYGPVFPEPKTLLTATPRIPGTDGRKMSKSYGNAVLLKDPPDVVRAEDPAHGHRPRAQAAHRPGRPRHLPGVRPAQGVLHARRPRSGRPQGCRTAGIGCLDCKGRLLDHLLHRLEEIHARRPEFAAAPRHRVGHPEGGVAQRPRGRPGDHGRGALGHEDPATRVLTGDRERPRATRAGRGDGRGPPGMESTLPRTRPGSSSRSSRGRWTSSSTSSGKDEDRHPRHPHRAHHAPVHGVPGR